MPPPDDSRLASDLLAAGIHEIKNRFGLLYSQLDQLLASLPLSSEHQHNVDTIKSEAQFIGSELMRILASYKTLGEGASANVDQQFLLDFLEEKVARHASTAAAHNVQMDFECDDELTAFFDAGIVSIVLDTAIYNAVKEQVKRVLLTADRQPGELLIAVHDDGAGFPPAMLEQPISQGVVKAGSSSTGLGLYFAQRLLGLQQEGERCGQIRLGKSDRLGGACVTLHLPQ
jgi:signal transduction histidine kinase